MDLAAPGGRRLAKPSAGGRLRNQDSHPSVPRRGGVPSRYRRARPGDSGHCTAGVNAGLRASPLCVRIPAPPANARLDAATACAVVLSSIRHGADRSGSCKPRWRRCGTCAGRYPTSSPRGSGRTRRWLVKRLRCRPSRDQVRPPREAQGLPRSQHPTLISDRWVRLGSRDFRPRPPKPPRSAALPRSRGLTTDGGARPLMHLAFACRAPGTRGSPVADPQRRGANQLQACAGGAGRRCRQQHAWRGGSQPMTGRRVLLGVDPAKPMPVSPHGASSGDAAG
jgi:hypothetical protein